MKMQIGRLGGVYALVLPDELVAKFDLREGQEIDAAAIEAVMETDREDRKRKRQEALRRLSEIRYEAPADWKFDREEANAR